MSFSNSRVVIPVENKIISLERRAGAYLIFIRNTHTPWSMRLGVAVLSSTNCCTALELRDKNTCKTKAFNLIHYCESEERCL